MQLSWSAPTSNTPPIAGYEVFFAESDSDIANSGGITTNTAISVTLPTWGVKYDLFVVAFSEAKNVLPSARSSNTTINLSEFYIFKEMSTYFDGKQSFCVLLKYHCICVYVIY